MHLSKASGILAMNKRITFYKESTSVSWISYCRLLTRTILGRLSRDVDTIGRKTSASGSRDTAKRIAEMRAPQSSLSLPPLHQVRFQDYWQLAKTWCAIVETLFTSSDQETLQTLFSNSPNPSKDLILVWADLLEARLEDVELWVSTQRRALEHQSMSTQSLPQHPAPAPQSSHPHLSISTVSSREPQRSQPSDVDMDDTDLDEDLVRPSNTLNLNLDLIMIHLTYSSGKSR